jgi:hypothetical protein
MATLQGLPVFTGEENKLQGLYWAAPECCTIVCNLNRLASQRKHLGA